MDGCRVAVGDAWGESASHDSPHTELKPYKVDKIYRKRPAFVFIRASSSTSSTELISGERSETTH